MTLETCDLWDIWSDRFSENFQIFRIFLEFWKIYKFSEKKSDFLKISDFDFDFEEIFDQSDEETWADQFDIFFTMLTI